MHLNDSQTALASIELLRLLLDIELLPWDEAYRIVIDTTVCTRHSDHSAMDTWPVSLLEKLLPRHLDLIYKVNFFMIEGMKQHYDTNALREVSMVVESAPKQIKFATLCFVMCHQINGVSCM